MNVFLTTDVSFINRERIINKSHKYYIFFDRPRLFLCFKIFASDNVHITQ